MRDVEKTGAQSSGKVQRSIGGIGAKLSSVAFLAKTVFTSSIVLAARQAVNAFIELETSLTKIETLVGLSGAQVRQFNSDINRLSSEIGKTPVELADALFFITSAGLRGADALDVLRRSAQASAVGLGETKVVADLVTSAMNAYGSETLDAATATDILLAAVREGKAEAPALAASLGAVLPIASEMGVTFDQVAASTAAMTRTGTDAAMAATAMRAILVGLLNPSEQAEQAFQRMGTSSAQLRRELREKGLVSVLGFLREQMERNDRAMSDAFPNVRALAGALDLMGANADENVQIFERLKDTTGLMDEAWNRASETADVRLNRSYAKMRQEVIALGESLTPLWVGIVEGVADATEAVGGLSTELRGIKLLFTELPGPIKAVTENLHEYVEALRLIEEHSPIGTARNLLGWFRSGLRSIGQASDAITGLREELERFAQQSSEGWSMFDGIHGAESATEDAASSTIDWNQAAMETVRRIKEIKAGIENVPPLYDNIFPTQRVLTDLEIAEQQIQNLIDSFDTDFDTSEFFDTGTIGAMREEIKALEDQLIRTTDPAKAKRLQSEIDALNESIQGMRYSTEQANEAAEFFSRTLADGLDQVLFRARSVEDAIKGILRQLASRALTTGIMGLLGGGFGAGGFLGAMFGGNRQSGGGVNPGRGYIVGERGPELFLPQSSGTIVPNDTGSKTINVNVRVSGGTRFDGKDLRYVIDEQVRQSVRLQ